MLLNSVRSIVIYEVNESNNKSANLLGIDCKYFSSEQSDDSELIDNTQTLHQALLETFQTSFDSAFDSAIVAAIEQQYQTLLNSSHAKTREKAKKYFPALHYFFCEFQNLTMIAKHLDMTAQYNVTNMLELKTMRAIVRRLTLQKILTELKQAMQSFPLQTLEDLDYAIAQIDRYMSAPAQIQINTPLVDHVTESIDQILDEESARSMNSINPKQPNRFTEAVCKIVCHRMQEVQHRT